MLTRSGKNTMKHGKKSKSMNNPENDTFSLFDIEYSICQHCGCPMFGAGKICNECSEDDIIVEDLEALADRWIHTSEAAALESNAHIWRHCASQLLEVIDKHESDA